MRCKSLLLIVCIFLLNVRFVKAQSCQPIHPGYINVPDTGVILPDTFPTATVGVPIVQVLTIGVPSQEKYQGNEIKINWIKFDSLKNAQPGMIILDSSGNKNYTEMNKGTWNCMTFEWTPTKAGTYVVSIVVDANVTIFIPVTEKNQTGGHITIKVNDATGISNYDLKSDYNSCKPNPFDDKTTLTYYSEKKEISELKLYSLTGQLVYAESLNTFPGKNEYVLDGNKLNKGVYLANITSSGKTSHQKLVKY